MAISEKTDVGSAATAESYKSMADTVKNTKTAMAVTADYDLSSAGDGAAGLSEDPASAATTLSKYMKEKMGLTEAQTAELKAKIQDGLENIKSIAGDYRDNSIEMQDLIKETIDEMLNYAKTTMGMDDGAVKMLEQILRNIMQG
jgi:hypothetical protein